MKHLYLSWSGYDPDGRLCSGWIKYQLKRYEKFCDELTPDGINGTEVETDLILMKDFSFNPDEVNEMKISQVEIYKLVKAKEGFFNWYATHKNEK